MAWSLKDCSSLYLRDIIESLVAWNQTWNKRAQFPTLLAILCGLRKVNHSALSIKCRWRQHKADKDTRFTILECSFSTELKQHRYLSCMDLPRHFPRIFRSHHLGTGPVSLRTVFSSGNAASSNRRQPVEDCWPSEYDEMFFLLSSWGEIQLCAGPVNITEVLQYILDRADGKSVKKFRLMQKPVMFLLTDIKDETSSKQYFNSLTKMQPQTAKTRHHKSSHHQDKNCELPRNFLH